MPLHVTLVWAPGCPARRRTPLELVVDTAVLDSASALQSALFRQYDTAACTVGGEPLDTLTVGVAPLVNGAVIIAGGSAPPRDRHRRVPRQPGLVFVVSSGPDAGQLIPLERGAYTVGRTRADIVLDDPEVSRLHAILTVGQNRVTLHDNSSVNGTWVDGAPVTDADISVGSTIRFGGSRCRLVLFDDPPMGEQTPEPTEPVEVRSPVLPSPGPPMVAAALLPLVLGIVLALTTGLWVFLGFSLLSAAVALTPVLTRRRGRRALRRLLADAADEDRERRRRAAPDPGSLVVAEFAPPCSTPSDRGAGGRPLQLRLGEGRQPARITVVPSDTSWTRPALDDVPVLIELDPSGVAPPDTWISGSPTALLATARMILLQLSRHAVTTVCLGAPEALAADARFLPGVALVGTPAALEDLPRARGAPVVLLLGSAAVQARPGSPVAGIFRFSCDSSPDRNPGPDPIRLALDGGRAELRGAGPNLRFRPDGVGTRWFGRVARARAGTGPQVSAPHGRTNDASPGEPVRSNLTRLAPSTPAEVARAWTRHSPGLAAPIGRSSAGTVVFDLVSDGPHLVIGGTTGSGKSELLRTLVLSIALHHGPAEVNFLFVDFKGGAALRPLSTLPHAVGLLTDLSAAEVARALVSLLAELRRREQLFALHAVTDISDWPATHRPALPRLVVVIDEFRMLVEDVPGATGDLMRIATLGRSLGVHLVMATQRPQGALGPDIRANVTASIALRVGSAVESQDIIGSAAAAAIPVAAPGRALLRVGAGQPTEFQAASSETEHPGSTILATGISELAGFLALPRPPTQHAGASGLALPSGLPRLLAAAVAAATGTHTGPLHRPVLPELPPVLTPSVDAAVPDGALELGLLDLPKDQSQRQLLWFPSDQSHLALVGDAAGGAVDALVHLLDHLIRRLPNRHLYLLDGDGSLGWAATAPQVGAIVGPDDPRRAARVLQRLSDLVSGRLAGTSCPEGNARTDPGLTVIISGWGRWAGALRTSRWAQAEVLVQDLARDGGRAGTSVVVSGARELTNGPLFPLLPNRLFFPLGATQESILLWPRLPPMAELPGRCLVQGPIGTAAGAVGQAILGREEASVPWGAVRPTTAPFRVLPMPSVVRDLPGVGAAGPPLRLPVGVGGDELDVVFLELTRHSVFLVMGGPGSGRTTLIDRIAAVTPAQTACLRPDPATDPAAFWKDLAESGSGVVHPDASLLLVDDADQLPVEAQRSLATLFAAGYRLVLTVTDSVAVLSKVPLAAHARSVRTGMVLAPRQPSDGDFFGVRLDCDHRARPGRGFLIRNGEPLELQVALGHPVG